MILPRDFGGNTAIKIDGLLSIHVLVLTFTMAHRNRVAPRMCSV